MNIDRIAKKYEKALELKKRDKYAATLKSELSKPEWKDKLQEITERVESIGSKSDFEKVISQLENLFENIYEKITAPGLDAFIEWVDLHAKNQENVKKLRSFLKRNYEAYSTSIDKILSAIDCLPQEDEKHLFDNLIDNFNKKIKSEVSGFVKDADKFEHTIDGFLSKLCSEYTGISAIADLAYTDINQLYTEEQKKITTLSFYEDIIKQAFAGGQSLSSPLDESEKDQAWHVLVSKRIRSINACITTLIRTGMSECKDEQLKDIFLRYDKDMLAAKGDVNQTLSTYLSKTWEPLQDKYSIIKNFYEEEELSFTESDWKDFEKEAEITALYKDYTTTRNGNILPQIPMTKLDEVSTKINNCHKKIIELKDKENNTGKSIREFFEEFVSTYNNKKQMLDKLIEKHPNLRGQYEEIYTQGKSITTLTNGINLIKNDGTFLKELSEGTICDMIVDMKKIKKTFLEILNQSQMEDQINWLNSLNSDVIGEREFNHEYLLTLIKEGLITLKFKKEF